MPFVVIRAGGKQYLVRPQQKLNIEKIPTPAKGKDIKFDEVLLYEDDKILEIGHPLIKGARVNGEFLGTQKAKKVIVFRYHSKTRYRKKKGHRQPYTTVLIKEIQIRK
ncbi:50S ribosomal protein L21 [Patescibacteria group bacterium]|nr:50S ribosomal protein L21 [Patescibacteria group bacterium]